MNKVISFVTVAAFTVAASVATAGGPNTAVSDASIDGDETLVGQAGAGVAGAGGGAAAGGGLLAGGLTAGAIAAGVLAVAVVAAVAADDDDATSTSGTTE